MNMERISQAKNAPQPTALLTSGVLQRKCACGQHTPGGGQCAACVDQEKLKQPLQAKLQIGAANDRYEQEADRVADQVMAMTGHSVVSAAPPRIQRLTGQSTGQPGAVAPASVDRVLASPGRPLESSLRQDMGQRFGYDFSQVRVHSGSAAEQSARDISARAYTVGRNVVFGAGQFAPKARAGQHLLAHELTHVVQQTGPVESRLTQGDDKHGLTSVPMLTPQPHMDAGSIRKTTDVLQRSPQTTGEDVPVENATLPPDFGDRPAEPGCPDLPTNLGLRLPEPPCPGSDEAIDGEHYPFCTDSDVFREPATPGQIAAYARSRLSRSIFKVHGFSSAEGDRSYNLNLSCHRAKRVARELLNAGVRSEQIQIAAQGETEQFGRNPAENRIVIVKSEVVAAQLGQDIQPATGLENHQQVLEQAKAKLERGEYNLAADAYISFWSCGQVPTLVEAVRRSTIRIGGEGGVPTSDRLGFDHPAGINTIILSEEMFDTANPVECVLARIIDLAFHHAVRSVIPDHAEQHRSALFLVELAGVNPCQSPDTELLPGIVERGRPWWRRPARDPRQGLRPSCADPALPGPIAPQLQPRVPRSIPTFHVDQFNPVANAGLTIWDLNRRQNLARMATPRGAVGIEARVTLTGDSAEFADYTVGFVQTITQANTTMEYASGHKIQETLPVPIRDGPPRRAPFASAPWFEPRLVDTPDTGTGVAETRMSDSPAQSMAYEFIDLDQARFFRRPDVRRAQQSPYVPEPQSGNVLNRAERHIVFNTWLVARHSDAPLDRFSTLFLEGRTIDFQQNIEVVGEAGNGRFSVGFNSAAAADANSVQLSGPTPADLTPTQKISLVGPVARAQAGGLSLAEWRDRIRQVAGQLEPLRRALGLTGQLMVRARVNATTGRLQITTQERPTITIEERAGGRGSSDQARRRFADELLARLRKDLVLAPMASRDAARVPIPTVLSPLSSQSSRQTDENPFAAEHGIGLLGQIREDSELARGDLQLRTQPEVYDPGFWPRVDVQMGQESYCYDFTVSGIDIDTVCVDRTMRTEGCVRASSAAEYTLRANPVYHQQQLGNETYQSPIALEVRTFPVRFTLFTPRENPGGETFNHEMHHLIDSYNLVRILENRLARRIRARLMTVRRLAAQNPLLKDQLLARQTLFEIVRQEEAPFAEFFGREFVAQGGRLHAREASVGTLPPYQVPADWTDFQPVTPQSGTRGSFTTRPCS